MKNEKLKLFIWTNFSPDWSGGLAFAIAKNEAGARFLIEKEYGFEPTEWGDLEIRSISEPVARLVSGGS